MQEPIWNRGPSGPWPWPWPWPWTAVPAERRRGVASAVTSSVAGAEPPSLQSGEEEAGAVTSIPSFADIFLAIGGCVVKWNDDVNDFRVQEYAKHGRTCTVY